MKNIKHPIEDNHVGSFRVWEYQYSVRRPDWLAGSSGEAGPEVMPVALFWKKAGQENDVRTGDKTAVTARRSAGSQHQFLGLGNPKPENPQHQYPLSHPCTGQCSYIHENETGAEGSCENI